VSARRRGSLIFGIVLCLGAIAVALAPMLPFALVATGWPLLLVALGVGCLAGFATKRRPASPALGAVLLVAGGLGLAFNLTSASGPVEFYGRWWPLFVGVFAIVEVVRYYSSSVVGGGRPGFITKGKLALLLVIAGSGLAAQRVASLDQNVLARLDMPFLAELRDGIFGQEFAFDAISSQAELEPGGTIRVANRFGDVKIEAGTGSRVEVALTARVRAYDREAADAVFRSLRLDVQATETGVVVGTNRGEIQRQISTDLVLRVPRGAAIRAQNDHGAIVVSGLEPADSGLVLETSHGPVEVRDVKGSVEVRNHHGDVRVTSVAGAVTVAGPYTDVLLSVVEGPVVLEGVDDVSLERVTAPSVRLVDVNHARVVAKNVTRGSGAAGAAKADLLEFEFSGSHSDVALTNIDGNVTIKTTHADVSATDVLGAVVVEAEHTEVNVTRVGSLKISTSYNDVHAVDVTGAVDVENTHGDIVLRLPVGPKYDIKSSVDHGKVRVDDVFKSATAQDGTSIPITVKTTYDDIVVKASGSRRKGGDMPRTGDQS
jgi:DUF4097 and DUF4098 domain-containing protein YvlB